MTLVPPPKGAAIHLAVEKGEGVFTGEMVYDSGATVLDYPAKEAHFPAMAIYALRRRDFLKNGNRIAVHRLLQQPPISPHRHEFFEIVIIFSGDGTHVTGNFRRKIAAGDVMVVNRKRAHGYEETRRLNLANILIREEVLKRIGRELQSLPGYHSLFNAEARHWRMDDGANRLKLSPQELEQIAEWVNRLEEESASESAGSPFIAEAYLTLIIAVLARKQPRSPNVVRRPLATFAKLQSWIEKNLGRKLSVRDLAGQVGMSERSFYRSFQPVVGCTPTDYLIQMRVQRAAEMLREVPQSRRISEIAEVCGFEDSNYFSRCFKRVKGCSPREFRAFTSGAATETLAVRAAEAPSKIAAG